MASGTDPPPSVRQPPGWLLLTALPLLGLAVLVARPGLDVEWRHQPSHFWLVLIVAALNLALAYLTNEAAVRRADARLILVSLAFGASAGFLGLHALATPGVLLPGSNLGFVIATPVGLTIAAALSAAAALPLGGPRGAIVVRHARLLRRALAVVLVFWGAMSLLGLPPAMSEAAPAEVAPPLRASAFVAVALYLFAAWRMLRLYLARDRPLLLAIVVALVLLAEAMIAVAVGRDWHLSWWEWHVLMAVASATVAWGARVEYRREGSLTGAFGGLYLAGTLERVDRWHAEALSDLVAARAGTGSTRQVRARLRIDGASNEELDLLDKASEELQRVDDLFRPYLPDQLAARARSEPARARPGSGDEREVTVLFADLSGFTSFSEGHAPTEVVELLNAIWSSAVPIVTSEGGLIESFAGDGMLVVFNALGDQADHPQRAARTALRLRDAVEALGAGLSEPRPRFHIGLNSGPAFVGSVGAASRRTFSVIGDTTNVGARLLGVAGPGEIVAGQPTWDRLDGATGEHLDELRLKGKRGPISAWRLDGLSA
jgi:adenylate cyclase